MVTRIYSEYRNIIIIFLVAFLLFSMPSLIRWFVLGNDSIIGFPTYMHSRIADYMASGNFDWYDPLSFGGRFYSYPPFFSAGMALFSLALPMEWAGLFFVSLFGAVGIVAFYLIARRFFPGKEPYLASVILLLTPGIVFLFSHVSTRGVPISLALLGLYFLLSGRTRGYLTGGFLLGAAALFHIEVGIVFGLVFALLSIEDRRILKTLAIAAAIAAIWYLPFIALHGFPKINDLHIDYRERRYSLESPTLKNYFFETFRGGHITFVLAILAIAGFVKTRNNFLRSWALLAFALSLLAERFFIYLPFPLALLAAISLPLLYKKKSKKILGNVLVVVFFIYITVFGAAKILQFADDFPKKEQYNAFLWIKENTSPEATVFSDWQWGHWISGIAKRKNFIDGYAEYAPNASIRLAELRKFYQDCSVPEGYGISYIYLEKWFIEQEGIDCLDKFDIVYNQSGLYVFRV